eukprot:5128270-Pleurochrysis_carterae.AAC.1
MRHAPCKTAVGHIGAFFRPGNRSDCVGAKFAHRSCMISHATIPVSCKRQNMIENLCTQNSGGRAKASHPPELGT